MKFAVLSLCFLTALSLRAVALVACPDCEGQVSSRAMMCPHCGCPGEAIAEYVKALQEAQEPEVIPPAETLQGKSDRGTFTVYPVQVGEACFLIADLAEVEGVKTLLIENVAHQLSVDYRRPELHTTLPIVRFSTEPTETIAFKAAQSFTSHWNGFVQEIASLPTDGWEAISPKSLRACGTAWRNGSRNAKDFNHPFYLNNLSNAKED